MDKKVNNYLKNHAVYNSTIHLITGAGLGVLATYPLFDGHTLRWGLGLLALGFLGYLYPLSLKGKK
ncbi:MAG: hypothetical protein UU73_C0003G0239 [Candidatus Daviesbacteria bacterium GW2011_GWA1_41_61]|uniref:Uncharacterized protein n=1 Tax=Candidatus Daviesbacteria bacterium GW2011_GWA2_40_9 TaxID=1618424 RepID=A0A0G0X827_9BACT|nr:MAG: hypothetical protein UU29_C0001G0022 [Candidatus Daviesbacteria bacterium GW2011_GWA2_40_9]KKR93411.1 MAG: hypothetical protein UU44_C0002G0072 [Candidatus Daviesbacteria bacterium GW2011_GWB1_41_15]KKS15040.1 MAG: hypothetical protein UU73_C0003G0239 [Candidatus Daviesbacteria bacterium GW2011_GWA1_41_61]